MPMWRSSGRAMCKAHLRSTSSRTIQTTAAVTRSRQAIASARHPEEEVPSAFHGEVMTTGLVMLDEVSEPLRLPMQLGSEPLLPLMEAVALQ